MGINLLLVLGLEDGDDLDGDEVEVPAFPGMNELRLGVDGQLSGIL